MPAPKTAPDAVTDLDPEANEENETTGENDQAPPPAAPDPQEPEQDPKPKVSKKRSARVAAKHQESKLSRAPTQSAADKLKELTDNMKQRGVTPDDLPDDADSLKGMYMTKANEVANLKKALALAENQRDINNEKAEALDKSQSVMQSLATRLEGKFRPVAGHSFQDIQAIAAPCRKLGMVGTCMYLMVEPVRDADGTRVLDDEGNVVYKVACSPVEMSNTVLVEEGQSGEFYRIKA